MTKPAESVEIKLEQALTGRLRKISRDRVAVQIEKADAHKAAVSQLLSSHSPTAPSGDPKPFRLTGPALGRPRDLGRISLLPSEPIPLCWAASTPETAGCANLGDSLSAVIVTALAAQQVQHTHFDAECQKLVAVGSIGHAIRGGDAVLWGTGVSIRGALLARNVPYTRYDIRAVRGPISAQHLRDFGLDVPEIYGDPVWLMPFIVDESVQPRYELGIIPHIRDVAHPHPDAPPKANSLRWTVSDADTDSVVVINTWHRPTWEGFLEKVRMILSCKRIVSQSFHGLVLAEAYGIPALNIRWVPDLKQGPARIDLTQDCKTDPRVWEFYKGGRREYFHMYNQRRDARSDWDAVIRAIDALWEPFDYDPIPLIEAFPLTIACAPWGTEPLPEHKLKSLKF